MRNRSSSKECLYKSTCRCCAKEVKNKYKFYAICKECVNDPNKTMTTTVIRKKFGLMKDDLDKSKVWYDEFDISYNRNVKYGRRYLVKDILELVEELTKDPKTKKEQRLLEKLKKYKASIIQEKKDKKDTEDRIKRIMDGVKISAEKFDPPIDFDDEKIQYVINKRINDNSIIKSQLVNLIIDDLDGYLKAQERNQTLRAMIKEKLPEEYYEQCVKSSVFKVFVTDGDISKINEIFNKICELHSELLGRRERYDKLRDSFKDVPNLNEYLHSDKIYLQYYLSRPVRIMAENYIKNNKGTFDEVHDALKKDIDKRNGTKEKEKEMRNHLLSLKLPGYNFDSNDKKLYMQGKISLDEFGKRTLIKIRVLDYGFGYKLTMFDENDLKSYFNDELSLDQLLDNNQYIKRLKEAIEYFNTLLPYETIKSTVIKLPQYFRGANNTSILMDYINSKITLDEFKTHEQEIQDAVKRHCEQFESKKRRELDAAIRPFKLKIDDKKYVDDETLEKYYQNKISAEEIKEELMSKYPKYYRERNVEYISNRYIMDIIKENSLIKKYINGEMELTNDRIKEISSKLYGILEYPKDIGRFGSEKKQNEFIERCKKLPNYKKVIEEGSDAIILDLFDVITKEIDEELQKYIKELSK